MAYSCVRVCFEFGHEASLRAKKTPEGFTHDWEVFVRGAEGTDMVHFVEKVIFYLHDSFPKPKRVVKEPPFLVKESGYAGFILPVEICFKNKDEPKNYIFEYDLQLQSSGPPINKAIRQKYTFTNPSEELRRRLIRGGGVGVGSEGGPIVEKPAPDEGSIISSLPFSSIGKPKLGGQFNKKHKEYKLEESRINSSNTHLSAHIPKPEKVSPDPKKTALPLPKPSKSLEKPEKSSSSKDSSNKERERTKEKGSSKHHSSPKINKEDGFIDKSSSSGESKKKKDKKSKDEKEAKRHESKHSDKTDRIEKVEKVNKSDKPSKDKDTDSSKKSSSSSSTVTLAKDLGTKPLEKAKEKEKEDKREKEKDKQKHSGDKDREKEKQKHKHKKKEKSRKDDEKDRSDKSSKKSKTQDKEKNKRPPSPPPLIETSPISFSSSSQVEVHSDHPIKVQNSTDSEVSAEEAPVVATNSSSSKKKEKNKLEAVTEDENNKKEGKKRKRKSAKGNEDHPEKRAASSAPEEVSFTSEYISELRELQQKIMTLEDNTELQKVVQVITETGQYEITSKTFDFDLCTLDKGTIRRLQDFFSSTT